MRPYHEQASTSAEPTAAVIIQFPVPDSDFGLVAALRSAHPDALLVLCERYSGELLATAARILGPERTIPDLIVKVLRQALARIAEPFETRQFRQWLHSLLLTEVRRRLRARRRWGWVAGSILRYRAESENFSELHLVAYRILDRMPEMHRLLFCLVMIHSLDLVEAATLLQIPLEQADQALGQAQELFLKQARRVFRHQPQRRIQLLSVGAAIVLEQDQTVNRWWITEYDLLESPKRHAHRPYLLLAALLPLLFLLSCATTILVSFVIRHESPNTVLNLVNEPPAPKLTHSVSIPAQS